MILQRYITWKPTWEPTTVRRPVQERRQVKEQLEAEEDHHLTVIPVCHPGVPPSPHRCIKHLWVPLTPNSTPTTTLTWRHTPMELHQVGVVLLFTRVRRFPLQLLTQVQLQALWHPRTPLRSQPQEASITQQPWQVSFTSTIPICTTTVLCLTTLPCLICVLSKIVLITFQLIDCCVALKCLFIFHTFFQHWKKCWDLYQDLSI